MFCDKIQYETYREAKKAINVISTREKQSFRVYKCSECSCFHLTSIPNKKLRKMPKEKYVKKYEKIEQKEEVFVYKKPKSKNKQQSIQTTYKPFQYFKK